MFKAKGRSSFYLVFLSTFNTINILKAFDE